MLGGKQHLWLHVDICGFGKISQFSKKDSKDQPTDE